MKRRKFITLLGGAATWPLVAKAQQQPAIPTIGFLHSASRPENSHLLAAFREGLEREGYVEGRNVNIEYRWAEGRYDRLPGLAAELVSLKVAVIAAAGGEPSPLAAKAATSTIPIVFTAGGDPVAAGLVASLNRPGGNMTGTTIMGLQMGSKRLDIVRQLVPTATNVRMLVNPKFPTVPGEVRDMQDAGRSLGIQIDVFNASTEVEIDTAFKTMSQGRSDALVIATDPFLLAQRNRLVRLAADSQNTHDLFLAWVRRCWWPHQLWAKYRRWIQAGRHLHRTNTPRRKSCHAAGFATCTFPAAPQTQSCKGARFDHYRQVACASRRSNRINRGTPTGPQRRASVR
jgi:putative ABC transport system substrate-binding protein